MAESAKSLNLLVFGATGRTARLFLTQAANKNHNVYAYLRNKQKFDELKLNHSNIHVIEGNLNDIDKISLTIDKHKPDAIYSMLSSDTKPHNQVSSCTNNVIQALKSLKNKQNNNNNNNSNNNNDNKQVEPIFCVPHFFSIAGLKGSDIPESSRKWGDNFGWWLAQKLYTPSIQDFELHRKLLNEAANDENLQLNFTCINPPLLTNGELTGKYKTGSSATEINVHAMDSISRADLADYCLQLAEKASVAEKLPQAVYIKS